MSWQKDTNPKTIRSGKKLAICNSTAEFLIFTQQAGEAGIEVRYVDDTIWLTQKLIAELFGVNVATINEHFKNTFGSGELQGDSVIRNFLITATDRKKYNTKHYNLDPIIGVGNRVNSKRATQFRNTLSAGELEEKSVCLDFRRTAIKPLEKRLQKHSGGGDE